MKFGRVPLWLLPELLWQQNQVQQQPKQAEGAFLLRMHEVHGETMSCWPIQHLAPQ